MAWSDTGLAGAARGGTGSEPKPLRAVREALRSGVVALIGWIGHLPMSEPITVVEGRRQADWLRPGSPAHD